LQKITTGKTIGGKPIVLERRKRQKTVRIRLKPDTVVVSAPYGMSKKKMVEFAFENKAWVLTHLEKLEKQEQQRKQISASAEDEMLVLGKSIKVEWKESHTDRLTYHQNDDKLKIVAPLSIDKKELKTIVYKSLAKRFLTPAFWKIQREIGYPMNKLYIRSQKTKWGTCSGKRNISLNYKLVKCPEAIQNYIIVHELCHLIHMNHSPKFWALVKHHYPTYKKAEKWLDEHQEMLFLV
jgi:predicted metal-dependent hydrolase